MSGNHSLKARSNFDGKCKLFIFSVVVIVWTRRSVSIISFFSFPLPSQLGVEPILRWHQNNENCVVAITVWTNSDPVKIRSRKRRPPNATVEISCCFTLLLSDNKMLLISQNCGESSQRLCELFLNSLPGFFWWPPVLQACAALQGARSVPWTPGGVQISQRFQTIYNWKKKTLFPWKLPFNVLITLNLSNNGHTHFCKPERLQWGKNKTRQHFINERRWLCYIVWCKGVLLSCAKWPQQVDR